MELTKSNEYAKYLVLADDSNGVLNGTYESYLNFKRIKEVVNNIAFTDKSTYSYEGDIYNRKISSTEAKNVINNLEGGVWNATTGLIKSVANQLKLRI